MNTPTLRSLVLWLAAILVVAACSSAAGPTASSGPSDQDAAGGAPSTGSSGSSSSGSSGSASPADPNTPVGGPVDLGPVDPGVGQAKLVIPRAGQLNLHSVGAARLEPAVDGRRVLVRVTWWSGVEPCNVLDSVKVERDGTAITIQLVEGTGDANAICIEIAEQKATIVDLGELEPGTYTIFAGGNGDATPVTVTIG